jgi:hypothetical protein
MLGAYCRYPNCACNYLIEINLRMPAPNVRLWPIADMSVRTAFVRSALVLGMSVPDPMRAMRRIWLSQNPRSRRGRAAFAALKLKAGALYVVQDVLRQSHTNNNLRAQQRATDDHQCPRLCPCRRPIVPYGPNYPALFRRAAEYVDRILHGTKPGDVPVEQPTKLDLVINLTTAKALGLTVPPSLLARADEAID